MLWFFGFMPKKIDRKHTKSFADMFPFPYLFVISSPKKRCWIINHPTLLILSNSITIFCAKWRQNPRTGIHKEPGKRIQKNGSKSGCFCDWKPIWSWDAETPLGLNGLTQAPLGEQCDNRIHPQNKQYFQTVEFSFYVVLISRVMHLFHQIQSFKVLKASQVAPSLLYLVHCHAHHQHCPIRIAPRQGALPSALEPHAF